MVISVLENTYRHLPGQPFWAVVQIAGTLKLCESLRHWEKFEREEVRQLNEMKRERERLNAIKLEKLQTNEGEVVEKTRNGRKTMSRDK